MRVWIGGAVALGLVGSLLVVLVLSRDGSRQEAPSPTVDQTVRVPEVLALQPDEATNVLEGVGLDPVFGSELDSQVCPGLIVRQEPEAGRRARPGTTVRYWVSSGAGSCVGVPDLEGRHINDAARALRIEGLELGERLDVFDESDPGTVLDQDPKAGQEVRLGASIDVTVSRGSETSTVPDVVGLDEADASTALANAGFRIARFFEANDEYDEGIVFDQEPSGGAKAESGTVVQIFVSEGP